MDWIYRHVGNFGLAILLITVIIKGIFFPLANKSYASMAKMKAVQPEMVAIRKPGLFGWSRNLAANRFPLRRIAVRAHPL
jgi:60Kd inner membrane protein